jgi:hypothetical protein
MGLLDGITHQEYYQGNDFGNYQFVSLKDIINQFMIVYVGDQKLIKKCSQVDVAFHAQRALAELSFDTFKSVKAQQIELPPTLIMPLPHDYVNYTKISWTDGAGIKHPLYPTKHTSNPFEIRQNTGGLRSYEFLAGDELIINNDFSDVGADQGGFGGNEAENWNRISASVFGANGGSGVGILDGKLMWSYVTKNGNGSSGWGQTSVVYQQLNTTELNAVTVTADGITSDITYTTDGTAGTAVGTIRFGLTTQNPGLITNLNNHPDYTYDQNATYNAGQTFLQSPFFSPDFFDIGYIEWTGTESSTKTIENLDIQNHDTIYIVALSFVEVTQPLLSNFALKPAGLTQSLSTLGTITGTGNINSLDNLSVTNPYANPTLSRANNSTNSSTWNNYKSTTPSENNNDDYEDDVYWPAHGERYGLEPSHAQVNGSFYIDQPLGNIHFSSNISGKTVILDYISDSLGTDEEMQVHKFAEEAMYRWILHAIASSYMYTQQIVPRLKKEKFAAIRQAKLRLSNLKLEELTQILRGKSKQIKH